MNILKALFAWLFRFHIDLMCYSSKIVSDTEVG